MLTEEGGSADELMLAVDDDVDGGRRLSFLADELMLAVGDNVDGGRRLS